VKCIRCIRSKARRDRRAGEMQPIEEKGCFKSVSLDFVGPLVETPRGNKWCLTACCSYSRYPFFIPLPDSTALSTAKAIFKEIVCVHGVPERFLSDQGAQFCGRVMAALCKYLKITRVTTTPYKPSTNGKLERMHAWLMSGLRSYITTKQDSWDLLLPALAFAYRSAALTNSKLTPYFLVHGRDPRLPLDALFQPPTPTSAEEKVVFEFTESLTQAHKHWRETQAKMAWKMKHHYDKNQKVVEYEVGELVYLHNPKKKKGMTRKLTTKAYGPYQVKEKLGSLNYYLKSMVGGRDETCHVQRLIPIPSIDKHNIPSLVAMGEATTVDSEGDFVLCDGGPSDLEERTERVGVIKSTRRVIAEQLIPKKKT